MGPIGSRLPQAQAHSTGTRWGGRRWILCAGESRCPQGSARGISCRMGQDALGRTRSGPAPKRVASPREPIGAADSLAAPEGQHAAAARPS